MTRGERDKPIARLQAMLRALPHNQDHAPRFIAMTDNNRLSDPLRALDLMPDAHKGDALLIWRLYDRPISRAERKTIAQRAKRKQIALSIAGRSLLRNPSRLLTSGIHRPDRHIGHRQKGDGDCFFLTAAAHDRKGIMRAARSGAHAVLISPVFPTPSHKDGKTLGPVRFAQLATLARGMGLKVYALGGMTDLGRIRRLRGSGLHGFAGIGFLQAG